MHPPFLIGNRIYLRKLHQSDIDGDYVSWLNDQNVCYYNSHAIFPYSKEDCLKYINTVNSDLVLAIILKDENRHIGNISLQKINYIYQSAEFAILLGAKDCWGKGYATEASSLIIKHGFNQLNLNRIHCGTSSNNKAMQKLAQSLGMVKEGVRREAMYKHGKFSDIIEYGILRNEFVMKENN